jgi:hypothetical protein
MTQTLILKRGCVFRAGERGSAADTVAAGNWKYIPISLISLSCEQGKITVSSTVDNAKIMAP